MTKQPPTRSMGFVSKCLLFCAGVVGFVAVGIKTAVQLEFDAWDVPAGSQKGRVAVITGANSGLGLETARRLAVAGA